MISAAPALQAPLTANATTPRMANAGPLTSPPPIATGGDEAAGALVKRPSNLDFTGVEGHLCCVATATLGRRPRDDASCEALPAGAKPSYQIAQARGASKLSPLRWPRALPVRDGPCLAGRSQRKTFL